MVDKLEDQVERVAKAMYDATHAGLRNCYAWEDAWEDHQEHHRDRYYKEARAAIAAMNHTPTEDARSRVKVLEEALRAILDGDVPRPVARQWRADGKPSKLDQCKHDVSVSEDCAGCTAEFVTTALGNKETDRHG